MKDGDGKLAEKSTASGKGHVCRAAFGRAMAPYARALACVARLRNCGRRLDGTEKNMAASDAPFPGGQKSPSDVAGSSRIGDVMIHWQFCWWQGSDCRSAGETFILPTFLN